MKREPICVLCSGALVKESDVWIQTSGSNTLCFSLAWVCKECGTSWPIGLKAAGLVKRSKSMWENSKRAE